MFSVKKHTFGLKALTMAAALAGTMAVSGIAYAQSVVVRSTGPSQAQYPKGKKLAADSEVTLKANDRVTVLDKAGTRVLSGPGTFTLDGRVVRDQRRSTRVAAFMSNGKTRARTGAVRGAGANSGDVSTLAAKAPNLWFIDVTRGGTYCIADPATQILWRPDIENSNEGSIAGASGTAELGWNRGNALKKWPTDTMPIVDGATYRINVNGMDTEQSVTTKVLDSVPDDYDATAEVLIANGCDRQLDLLVDTLAATDNAVIDDQGEL